MRTTALFTATAALAATLLLAPPAGASGVGFYGSVGGGLAEWDQAGPYDDRRDTTHAGYGLVLDTAGPRDLLSYRVSVGYEKIVHEADYDNDRLTLRGIVVDQDLTLDLLGGPNLRVWLGPELRLGVFRGEGSGPEDDLDFFAVGVGPVVGFDYQVGPSLGLSWKLGYLVTGYGGTRDRYTAYDRDAAIGEGHAYLALSILFQTWSQRRQQQEPPTYYPRY